MSEKTPNNFIDKHKVVCPHCPKDVLDHMTVCPFCGGKLIPQGYNPPNPAKMKKIKLIAWVILGIVATAIAIFIILDKL
ncbi:MAG: hypothetical protein WC292_05470 [Clostridia bacterium]